MKNKAYPGRVVFDHLPKTGGQSINAWLLESLGTGCVTSNLVGKHSELIRYYGGLFSVICSHIDFNDGQGLDLRYEYITILRNPLDRAVSWLYFMINNNDESEMGQVCSSAKAFLDSDGQCVNNSDVIAQISNVYVEHFSRIESRGKLSEEDKIASALAAIKKYNVVGIYEQMPQFISDVAMMIGIPQVDAIPRVNVTTQRPSLDEVSPVLLERLMELNQLDLRFYNEIVAWKASGTRKNIAPNLKKSSSFWMKYEAIKNDRVFLTSDFSLGSAVLREGYRVSQGQLINFDVEFSLSRDICDLEMGIHIFDSNRCWVFGTNTTLLGQSHKIVSSGSYCVAHHLLADLPPGKYTAGFSFAEKLTEGLRELAWFDILCAFQVDCNVNQTFAGYIYLPTQMSFYPSQSFIPDSVVSNPLGGLIVKHSLSSMLIGERASFKVEIVNSSGRSWVGDHFRPINLAYYWLDNNEGKVLGEGIRTPLQDRIVANGKLSAEMLVEAPVQEGRYKLVLTLVQENVSWFEKMGECFKPAILEVVVNRHVR